MRPALALGVNDDPAALNVPDRERHAVRRTA
jgi:hypothetical protein